jgi:hypothetical protein
VDNMPVAVFVRCLGCGLRSEDSGGEIVGMRIGLVASVAFGGLQPPSA